MEKEKLTKFKWFWAWNDDQEEKWLEALSQKGWHLEKPGFPGFYHFSKGEPRNYSYRLDFRTGSLKSLEDYLQICRDAGWEAVGRMGTWYYFRKECRGGEKPEFFSDKDSKIQKYRRLIIFLVVFLPIMLNGARIIFQHQASWFFTAIGVLYVIFLLVWTWAIIRLLQRVSRLKKT